MTKVEIDLPAQFIFSTEIAVRVSDVNYGGHLGNDSLVSILHEARVRFLKSMGFTELDFSNVALIMADLAVSYKNEAFMGDLLVVAVSPGNIKRASFDLFYRVVNKESGKCIAEAKTGMVCFDYKTRKIATIPKEIMERWNSLPGSEV